MMKELIWIICIIFVTDAAFHRCEISFPDEPPQGQGSKGEPSKSCNCLELAEELALTKEDLIDTNKELSQANTKLVKAEQELSNLKEKPRDCYDVIYYNPNSTSGVYTIFPPNYRPEGIEVLCDMDTDGGGWIVFQARRNGSVDFYRGWNAYLVGFGDFESEFWLGLEYIHQLTKYGTYDLRIDVADFEQNEDYAGYLNFSVGEGPGYVLNVGDHFGSAGDSLTHHNNMKFTTFDKDQDQRESGNCAVQFTGAWWYVSCHQSNLNGQYLRGATDVYAKGVVWHSWKGYYYSLKSTEMKIRPNYARYA